MCTYDVEDKWFWNFRSTATYQPLARNQKSSRKPKLSISSQYTRKNITVTPIYSLFPCYKLLTLFVSVDIFVAEEIAIHECY